MSDSFFPDLAVVFALDEMAAPKPSPRGAARAVDERKLLADLSEPRRGAVVHAGPPALVVVGAGSGRTRVLTRHIAYLMGIRGVYPGAVLAITFTNKTAAETRDRVTGPVGDQARMMRVSTFHSACVRIPRPEIGRLSIARFFSIYDGTDVKRLVSLVMRDQELDPRRFPARVVINAISGWKNDLVDFETVKEQASDPVEKANAEVHEGYQARSWVANALDFDNLIMTTADLFQAPPEIHEEYHRRFRHALVGEYRDTNHTQYALIRELCGQVTPSATGAPTVELTELMVVGDSDQSIYALRGATIRSILDPENSFPDARTIALDQNYHSTDTMLQAANAMIARNRGRRDKALWSDLGDGASIVGQVAGTKHDGAQFVAGKISRLIDDGRARYGDVAMSCQINVQSQASEGVFIRVGMSCRAVGRMRFYERREIRDAIAYLWAIADPADDVSVRRILNVPKRGIDDRAVTTVPPLADTERIHFFETLLHSEETPGLVAWSVKQTRGFADLIERHHVKMAQGDPADEIFTSVLTGSGYLAELQNSIDSQDETRLENPGELVNAMVGFVVATNIVDLDEGNESGLMVGMSGPDVSLPAFLERIALMAGSDRVLDGEQEQGVVTLITLHAAKGLKFDTMFLTGMEKGVFPYLCATESQDELKEEYRLAYVGIARARKLLHLSRVTVRIASGQPNHNPAPRFLEEIPEGLMN